MSWYWLTVIAVIFLVVCGVLAAVAIQLRQELEDKLADYDRLRTLWDNFPGVVTEIRPDGTITHISVSILTGAEPGAIQGTNVRDYLDDESYALFAAARDALLSTGAPQTYDIKVQRHSGATLLLTNRLLPIIRDGRLTSMMILSLDRSEVIKVETELMSQKDMAEGASAAKSRFLASMSHEIRNPLNSMLGMLTLLGATRLESRQRHYLTTLQQAADHLLGIVNDVLDLSRIEAGKLELNTDDFDLPDLAQHVASMMHHQASEKRLALQLFISDDVPVNVRGDALRVRQILMNLLSNAVKFTTTGHVILRLASSQTGVRFTVEDTGVGIEPERARNLFEEYSTVHGKLSLDQGGTGLGLNICKRLTEAMGGYIGVLSTPGIGSCFWVDLPLNQISGGLFRDAMPQEFHQRTLWVADSFAVNRTLVVSVARRLGLSVRGFDRLRDLLAALESEAPDILVMSRRFYMAPDTQHRSSLLDQKGMRVAVSCDETFSEDWKAPQSVSECWSWPVDQRELSAILSRMLGEPGSDKPADQSTDQASGMPDIPEALNLRVLLVEDDKVNRTIADHMLRKLGCKVVMAINGEAALEKLASGETVDIVLMDRHMPGMGGLEATRQIHAQAGCEQLPVLALSADVMPEQQAEFMAAGAAGYISKPLRPEELRATLARWIPVRAGRSRME